MTDDGPCLVRLVPRRAGDGQAGALPPEFLHLQELLEQFALEARAALEPRIVACSTCRAGARVGG